MTSTLQAEALKALRYNLFVHLDAAEHLAIRHGAFDDEDEQNDINSAMELIPDLVEVIREIVRDEETDDRTLETIYRMVKDPKREFVKLQERFRFR